MKKTLILCLLAITAGSSLFAETPFEVLPKFGSAQTEVLLRGVTGTQVLFNGVEARALRTTPQGLVATVPLLSDGLVDITVKSGDVAIVASEAFKYTTQFDLNDYTRVLFPVAFDGPGARGSRWTSDNVVFNEGPLAIVVVPPIVSHIPPETAVRVPSSERDGGVTMLVPRGLEPFLHFASHIRDVSRESENRGAEIPIVFEGETSSTVRVMRVPLDARFRPRLRIYDLDGNESPVTVTIVAPALGHFGTLTADLRRSAVCFTVSCGEPAFGGVDLSSQLSDAEGSLATVTVSGGEGRRLWAFVSVTNNDTQQVTTYSPRRANR